MEAVGCDEKHFNEKACGEGELIIALYKLLLANQCEFLDMFPLKDRNSKHRGRVQNCVVLGKAFISIVCHLRFVFP